jgi:hypothetical protein
MPEKPFPDADDRNRIKPFLVEALRRRAEEGGAGAGAPGKKKGE